jgi:hypothetical protein
MKQGCIRLKELRRSESVSRVKEMVEIEAYVHLHIAQTCEESDSVHSTTMRST